MTPRNLFNIILKVLGILFIKDILAAVPSLLSIILYFKEGDTGGVLFILFSTLLMIGCFTLVAWYLLFRTDWLIDQLKLDKGFNQETFALNMHRSTVLGIAVIVVGGLILVDEVPNLVRLLYEHFQQRKMMQGLFQADYTPMIFSGIKIIIGLLLLGNQRALVNFIEYKRRN